MNTNELKYLKNRFTKYTDSFISDRDKQDNPFVLKKEHTKRVCKEILMLSDKLSISTEKTILAEAAALLHDIGRFQQYKKYGTFLDAESTNHAKLSCKVIKEENMLDFCPAWEKNLLFNAIFFHNVFALPANKSDSILLILKLLRDADKLDIWEVVTDHYLSEDQNSNRYISFGLKDNGEYSLEILKFLYNSKVADSKFVKTLNDLKLLQISWVFDLNFSHSVQRIQEKKCIEKIFSTLPGTEELKQLAYHVDIYINKITS